MLMLFLLFVEVDICQSMMVAKFMQFNLKLSVRKKPGNFIMMFCLVGCEQRIDVMNSCYQSLRMPRSLIEH